MRFIRCAVVAMMGSLLLLSTGSAQTKTSFPPRQADRENLKSWTRFTSHSDKFEVLMPAAPTLKQESLVISGEQLLLSYYGARRGQSDYAVLTLAGFNEMNWHFAHMLLLDLYSRSNTPASSSVGAQSSSSFKATFKKDISLGGHAGRQFSLESDERVGEWRIYEIDKTFYAVAASSPSRHTSLSRFLDSFALADNKPTVAAADTEVRKRVSPPADRWLIILQTYSRNERAQAIQKMNVLQSQGYDTRVVSTDSYSNLKPGLLVLAMGPFSKQTAEQRLGALRSVAPQSYIKAGW